MLNEVVRWGYNLIEFASFSEETPELHLSVHQEEMPCEDSVRRSLSKSQEKWLPQKKLNPART